MAHAIVEWTDNLAGETDISELLALIAAAMRDSDGVFPWGGIRVRGIRLSDYVIADGAADDAFIHITIKMAAGRPAAFRQAFFATLFARITSHFAALTARRYLALSMYVEEIDEATSFRQNNIHRRFAPPAP